ncbi:MAG: pyridoxal-phosphate dependent enzyme [Planctomycetota bacterium]
MSGVAPPAAAEVERAADVLRDVAVHTQLVALRGCEDVWLKPEIHQPVGCFKIRGVYHAVHAMAPEARAHGISTVSAGNTAKALAWCGRRFGVEARSLMPDHAPKSKIEAVRALGGTPVLVPVDDVFAYLKEHRWEQEPYGFVHPWTSRDVLVGHATLALELARDLPDLDTVYVPVGGGGLLGGVGGGLRALLPDVRIVAVEPEGCPSLHAALQAGHPVDVDCDTICDGVAVPYMTDEMFPLLRDLADDSVLVSERAVADAIRHLALKNHIVAEGSGALAVAAALAEPPERRGRAVALVTGGSIDAPKLAALLDPSR